MDKKEICLKYSGKSFLKLLDFSTEDINNLLELSAIFKAEKKQGIAHRMHEGKNVVLLFEKTSTRTRCAFEVAAADLGMNCVYLDPQGSQMGKKESLEDTARVLGRMFDGIEYRGYDQSIVEMLSDYSKVPVWNGLTNQFHPTQVLADLLTVKENFGSLEGKKLVFMGDCRFNMANSLMVGCAKMGMHFVACAPEAYFPGAELTAECKAIAEKTGGSVSFITDPFKATAGADVIYTDVWVSMGEPQEVWAERIADLKPYAVTDALMENAGEKCIFMHCLPSFHDLKTTIGKDIYDKFGLESMEVADSVFNSKNSVVFDEAENRMHTIKAVMAATLPLK